MSLPATTPMTPSPARMPAVAAASPGAPSPGLPVPQRLPREADGRSRSSPATALHVARRLAYGPTGALLAELERDGVEAWIESQLRPGDIDDSRSEAALAGFVTLGAPARVLRLADHPTHEIRRELRVATLLRAVHSRRQLLCSMAEVWHDHFNVDASNYWVALSGPTLDREAIRPHALGRFVDLLPAVATSVAMLTYLDNASNRAPGLNENYARELLELHTVGVASGFTEEDVRGTARLLSGWGVDTDTMAFTFRPAAHDPAAADVLGLHVPAGTSVERGRSLLAHLARHPATAVTLATRLAARFVGPAATRGLVTRAAKAYLGSDTDIPSLLRVLFASDEFWTSHGAVVRRPFDQLAAWLRGLDATTDTTTGASAEGTRQLERELALLGHLPFGWASPDGPPVAEAHWSGSALQLARWRLASRLAADRVPGVRFDREALAAGATTVGELLDVLGPRLLGAPLRPEARGPLRTFAGGEQVVLASLPWARRRELFALVLLVPDGQTR